MQRYFVDPSQINNQQVVILGEDCHHIGIVMRMAIGDEVYVSDQNNSYLCKIVSIFKEQVLLDIEKTLDEHKEMPYQVTIAQGLVRKEKMEEVIDYICELGAASYLPVQMERSLVKINLEKVDKKSDRYAKIAKEASEQSHRTKIMKVENPIYWKEFLAKAKNYDLCLYAYEKSPKDDSLKKLLKQKNYKNILVLVGPEGGISEQEVSDLKANHFLPITLGPRILRTQVAPLYLMAALSYEWEEQE